MHLHFTLDILRLDTYVPTFIHQIDVANEGMLALHVKSTFCFLHISRFYPSPILYPYLKHVIPNPLNTIFSIFGLGGMGNIVLYISKNKTV